MDKKEALTMFLKISHECSKHHIRNCTNCPFSEVFDGKKLCIFNHVESDFVAMAVKAKLDSMGEKQEAKSSVPLENVGSIIAYGPSTIKESVPLPKDISSLGGRTMKYTIRWFDGFLEHGKAEKWRIGNSYLWVLLDNGEERWYPLHQVRWFCFGDSKTNV